MTEVLPVKPQPISKAAAPAIRDMARFRMFVSPACPIRSLLERTRKLLFPFDLRIVDLPVVFASGDRESDNDPGLKAAQIRILSGGVPPGSLQILRSTTQVPRPPRSQEEAIKATLMVRQNHLGTMLQKEPK